MKLYHGLSIGWKRIRIIDKYLIVIMAILLVYSMLTLWFGPSASEHDARMDIFARTSIASIFGYFISSNFIKNEQSDIDTPFPADSNIPSLQASSSLEIFDQGQHSPVTMGKIGFTFDDAAHGNSQLQESAGSSSLPDTKLPLPEHISANRLQIQIVGILCLFSIGIMATIRFFDFNTASEVSTITQFQDMICASIGFLIGMPNGQTK